MDLHEWLSRRLVAFPEGTGEVEFCHSCVGMAARDEASRYT